MALPVTANLYAHYEADTLGLSNGASVTSWPDASGNGNTLAQTGGVSLPTYETNSLNGLGGVKFDGTHRRIADITLTGAPSTKTIFLVVKNPTNNGTIRYFTNTATLLMAKWSNADRFIFGNSSGNFLEFTETGIAGAQGQWTYVHRQTGALLRWNQVQKVTGNLNAPSTDTAIVMGDDVADMGLTVYEWVIYSAALSAGDIDLVEDYLFTKWFTVSYSGSGASTLAGVTSAGSGTFTPAAVTGTGASTLAGVSSAGTGAYTPGAITGTGASTLAGVTSAGTGTFIGAVTGAGASTLEGVTSAGAGTFTLPGISGTGASTLQGVTSMGTGVFTGAITGAGASTLAGVTSVGVGFFGDIFFPDITCEILTLGVTCETTVLPIECAILTLGVECGE